jgi:hypothetical protein
MAAFWINALRIFATVWFVLAGALILTGILMIWARDGFGAVQQVLSPFNVLNFIVMFVTLLPGIAARMLADRLAQRKGSS